MTGVSVRHMAGQSALFSLCCHYSKGGQALGGVGDDCRGGGERWEVVVVVFSLFFRIGFSVFPPSVRVTVTGIGDLNPIFRIPPKNFFQGGTGTFRQAWERK